MPGEWRVEERRGSAASLHEVWPGVLDHPEERALAVCHVTEAAVVLGSTQPGSMVDRARAAAAGVTVARRRSGGGAVLVTPEDPVWVDAWLPAGDPLWRDDVGRAFDWLGETWTAALGRSGITGVSAHRGGYVSCTRWATSVCFGGVGTGEVVAADGRKVVGLAQRRDRHGAWFHGACYLHWDPDPSCRPTGLVGSGTSVRRRGSGHRRCRGDRPQRTGRSRSGRGTRGRHVSGRRPALTSGLGSARPAAVAEVPRPSRTPA